MQWSHYFRWIWLLVLGGLIAVIAIKSRNNTRVEYKLRTTPVYESLLVLRSDLQNSTIDAGGYREHVATAEKMISIWKQKLTSRDQARSSALDIGAAFGLYRVVDERLQLNQAAHVDKTDPRSNEVARIAAQAENWIQSCHRHLDAGD